jgi:hypothetical protein
VGAAGRARHIPRLRSPLLVLALALVLCWRLRMASELRNRLRWRVVLPQMYGFRYPEIASFDDAAVCFIRAVDAIVRYFEVDARGHQGGRDMEDRLGVCTIVFHLHGSD